MNRLGTLRTLKSSQGDKRVTNQGQRWSSLMTSARLRRKGQKAQKDLLTALFAKAGCR